MPLVFYRHGRLTPGEIRKLERRTGSTHETLRPTRETSLHQTDYRTAFVTMSGLKGRGAQEFYEVIFVGPLVGIQLARKCVQADLARLPVPLVTLIMVKGA